MFLRMPMLLYSLLACIASVLGYSNIRVQRMAHGNNVMNMARKSAAELPDWMRREDEEEVEESCDCIKVSRLCAYTKRRGIRGKREARLGGWLGGLPCRGPMDVPE